MTSGRLLSRRNIVGAVALGAGTAAAAGWAVQHRLAARAVARTEDLVEEGLTLSDGLVHHFVDVDDGGRIHVVEAGQGPPIVLLHGYMLTSALWAHCLRDLSAHHRVIAIDLRGHGQSIAGDAGFSAPGAVGPVESLAGVAPMAEAGQGSPGVRRLAADVAAVLVALDVEHAVVVGHSMGGMVALQLASDLGPGTVRRRLAGLVLVSTLAGPFSAMPGFPRVARLFGPLSARAVMIAEHAGVHALPAGDVAYWVSRMGFGADAPAAQVRFVESMHRATPGRTVSGLLPSLAAFNLSAELGSIDIPVLVVVGTHDRLTPPRHARRMTNALAQAELVELPRCGHMPMIERRHEFVRLVDEFAAKIG